MKKMTVTMRDLAGNPTEVIGRVKGLDVNTFRTLRANFDIRGRILNYGFIVRYLSGHRSVQQHAPKVCNMSSVFKVKPIMLDDIL